jgi:hypothetical protein
MKTKITVLALGAALAFCMASGAWAQGGGAGGGTGRASGGAAGAGTGGGSGVGGRGAPSAHTPSVNPSTPVLFRTQMRPLCHQGQAPGPRHADRGSVDSRRAFDRRTAANF